MKEKYHISGMTCSACSAHVEKAVRKLPGVEKASVNLLTETMEIVYDEAGLNREGIVAAVEKAGYGASRIAGSQGSGAADRRSSAQQKEPAKWQSSPEQGNGAGRQGRSEQGEYAASENTVTHRIAASRNSVSSGAADERDSLRQKAKEEDRAMKWRLGISVFFLLLLMYVAMYHMYNDLFGLPIPDFVMKAFHGSENAMTFALTQLLLLLPIIYMNRKFFAVGFKTLRHLSPNMDSLIALGASAALGYGIFAMYRISYGLGHGDMALVEQYSHDLYFESAGMILTLITVGKYLEGRSKGKTSEAITKLMDLSPKMAVVLDENGEEVLLPTELLQKGDTFLVKPGSLVPADGTVVEGSSSVDEAAITGESIPVEKQAGDKVVSATMNKSGFLKCRAERVGEDTTLSQIIRLVEEASGSKAPIAKLADKVAGVFVPVVMGIASLTLICWLLAGASAEFAISTAIAVLVISCPCALGLATPVAIMVGTGVGARNGVLIKSGEALQTARGIDTVVFDKTGTITEGRLKVLETKGYVKGMTTEQLLSAGAAVEKQSEHPLAEAVIKEAQLFNCEIPKVKDFRAVFGRGIEGVLESGFMAGARIIVGNRAYLEEQGISLSEEQGQASNSMADEGMTPLWVAAFREGKGEFLGLIGVADEIKSTSRKAISALKKMGIHVVMLTGDNKRTAEAVRQRMGIEEVIAEVLPQDKERHIRALKEQGHRVAMVGDGINDAPALAAADVGMAIGAGTDVAMESADIILVKNDLRDAVTAIRLSRAVIRNIKQNLFWAFFYNSIGIPLAAGLLYPALQLRLTPMFGAAAMSMSSIFVVGNALRLRGFKSGFRSGTGGSGEGETEEVCQESRPQGNLQEAKDEEMNNKEKKDRQIKKERSKAMNKVMTIEGMMCGHCTGRVQKALEAVEGVSAVSMSLEEKTATVELAAEVADEALTAAVIEAGYEVKSIH